MTDASDGREPTVLVLLLLGLTGFIEGADTQLLPASTLALQQFLTLPQLASLNVAQAVCVNIAAPLWGVLADRRVTSRRNLLIMGALGQAAATMCLSLVSSLGPMIFLRCCAGICLASLRPIANGVVADVTSESKQGKVFGRLQALALIGMFTTTMAVVPIARWEIFGILGWRVAFVTVGLASVAVSCALFFFFEEPVPVGERPRVQTQDWTAENEKNSRSIVRVVLDEITKLTRFFRLPTFCMMIVQGIFGTIPWTVMGFMASYFQLNGIKDFPAAILASEMAFMGVPGNILGGIVADKLAQVFGSHGRPLSAQLTVLFGLIPMYQIFWGVSPSPDNFPVYFVLIAFFGLFGSWAQSGTNFPILADIVPSESRSSVMAWESAFENSIANAVGPPVVAILAVHIFGYNFDSVKTDDGKPLAQDLDSARALGTAMAACTCIPAVICFCAYSVMHWSYPRDSRSRSLAPKTAKLPVYGTV